jgi:hypothetical protein
MNLDFMHVGENTDSMFRSLNGFSKFLNKEALKYSHPIEIK